MRRRRRGNVRRMEDACGLLPPPSIPHRFHDSFRNPSYLSSVLLHKDENERIVQRRIGGKDEVCKSCRDISFTSRLPERHRRDGADFEWHYVQHDDGGDL